MNVPSSSDFNVFSTPSAQLPYTPSTCLFFITIKALPYFFLEFCIMLFEPNKVFAHAVFAHTKPSSARKCCAQTMCQYCTRKSPILSTAKTYSRRACITAVIHRLPLWPIFLLSANHSSFYCSSAAKHFLLPRGSSCAGTPVAFTLSATSVRLIRCRPTG